MHFIITVNLFFKILMSDSTTLTQYFQPSALNNFNFHLSPFNLISPLTSALLPEPAHLEVRI